jgi:protein-L-isoaspartate(D-aspartate) O-methyltransferase
LFSRTRPESGFSFPALLLFLLLVSPAGAALYQPSKAPSDGYQAARRVMIERDLRGRGIKDSRVLAAMDTVPRHRFVPEKLGSAAYDDRPLPIGERQTISQPYIVAFMSELLELKPTDKVLEIGTGSGYQTGVLSQLAEAVSTIEILPALGERAKKILDELNFNNIAFKIGDGFYGWEERAPFDAILVTAAAPKIPEALVRQLRDGGRLVMPLGAPGKSQRLIRARKEADRLKIEDFSEVLFVPLRGAIEQPAR